DAEERIIAGWAVLQGLLAIAVSLLFVWTVSDGGRSLAIGHSRLTRALGILVLTGPGAIAFLATAFGLAFGRGRPPVPSRLIEWWLRIARAGADEVVREGRPSPPPVCRHATMRGATLLFDLAAVATIVAVVYSPGWDRITAL